MTDDGELFILTITWLAYFALHSLLASLKVKRWLELHVPAFIPWYRLVFNLIAITLLLVPLWMLYSQRGELIIDWSGYAQWISHCIALLAIGGFVWSARYYDGSEFLGIKQLSNNIRQVEDQESFHVSPLHRFVRHPWYFLGLLLLWSRDMDAGLLLSACLITLYIVIGSRLEENKLIEYHGRVYSLYSKMVPGLIPLPWKYLTRQQAQDLLEQAESGIPTEKS